MSLSADSVVDLDAMERNIQRMADFARKHQVRWRPHAKLHKSAALALQLQQRVGAGLLEGVLELGQRPGARVRACPCR